MRNTRPFQLLLLLWMTLPAFSRAQDAGRPLSWEDCVSLAIKSNPDLSSSRLAAESSRASYYGSYNGILPQLSLTNSYGDSNASDGSTRWQAQGTASLNVFSASQLANIRSASASLSQALATLRIASSTLRFNLRQAFAQLLFAEKSLEVSRLILDMRQKSAQMVNLRYDSGAESKGNMLRSKAQAFQAQADLAQAARNLRTAQKGLDRQLGLDEFNIVAVTGALEAQAPPDLPQDMRAFLAARPDVALQEAAIKSAQASLSQARSSLWPSLSANYTRSRLGREEVPNSVYNWTFTGLLSYPLFGGGPTATYFAVSSAKRGLEKSQQDLRTIRDQAVLDLENSWAGFGSASDQVKVQTALLEAARQRNDEADVRYASGLLTYDNWEIIASDRINQERLAIQARLNVVNAEAAWNKSIGKELGE